MASVSDTLGELVGTIVAAIVLLVLAVISFFITVFVVDFGAGLANFDPSGDFVVLAAAVITGASILAGAAPVGAMGGVRE